MIPSWWCAGNLVLTSTREMAVKVQSEYNILKVLTFSLKPEDWANAWVLGGERIHGQCIGEREFEYDQLSTWVLLSLCIIIYIVLPWYPTLHPPSCTYWFLHPHPHFPPYIYLVYPTSWPYLGQCLLTLSSCTTNQKHTTAHIHPYFDSTHTFGKDYS